VAWRRSAALLQAREEEEEDKGEKSVAWKKSVVLLQAKEEKEEDKGEKRRREEKRKEILIGADQDQDHFFFVATFSYDGPGPAPPQWARSVEIRECRARPGRPFVTDSSSVTDRRNEFIYKIGVISQTCLGFSCINCDAK